MYLSQSNKSATSRSKILLQHALELATKGSQAEHKHTQLRDKIHSVVRPVWSQWYLLVQFNNLLEQVIISTVAREAIHVDQATKRVTALKLLIKPYKNDIRKNSMDLISTMRAHSPPYQRLCQHLLGWWYQWRDQECRQVSYRGIVIWVLWPGLAHQATVSASMSPILELTVGEPQRPYPLAFSTMPWWFIMQLVVLATKLALQKVNVCKYPPIGRMEILSMAGLCL